MSDRINAILAKPEAASLSWKQLKINGKTRKDGTKPEPRDFGDCRPNLSNPEAVQQALGRTFVVDALNDYAVGLAKTAVIEAHKQRKGQGITVDFLRRKVVEKMLEVKAVFTGTITGNAYESFEAMQAGELAAATDKLVANGVDAKRAGEIARLMFAPAK